MHSHASHQQGDFFREENQENVAAAQRHVAPGKESRRPSPSSSEVSTVYPLVPAVSSPLSPGSTPGQSPAHGPGCPGPGEMLGRKKNKLEEDKEAQALQPSQLGTDVVMRAEVTIGCRDQLAGLTRSTQVQRAPRREHCAQAWPPSWTPQTPPRHNQVGLDTASFQDTARAAWKGWCRQIVSRGICRGGRQHPPEQAPPRPA